MSSDGVRSILGSSTEYLAVFGGVTASYWALKFCFSLLRVLRTYIFSRFSGVGSFLRAKGQWAVVTGATDGIGKEYARQLAGFGINIVLISRTESKLKTVASEIESEFKIKTMIVAADFSQGTSIYDNIRSKLSSLEIGVLVNNVGLSYEFPEYFLELQDRDKLFMNLLHVNCTSATLMSSIVLEGMVHRRKGVIINIASAAGNAPTPLLSVYSACKVYVQYLSECLNVEYADKGITIQSVNPFFVCSNMSKVRRPSLFIPSAASFVKSALRTVGTEPKTSGYFPHHLTQALLDGIPYGIAQKIAFNGLLSANKRAKRKMAAKKSS